MADRHPFILLDDARSNHAGDAHLFERPSQIFVARTSAEVETVLAQADEARRGSGASLAGYIAYEAGLALEPHLRELAQTRFGANGPMVWLGLFEEERIIPRDGVDQWLSDNAEPSPNPPAIGPLNPQISPGAYVQAFAKLQDAIRAGDIYQANLTFPLAGSYHGDPIALYAALRQAAKAGYGGLIYDGSHWLLSLSPELFLSVKDGEIRAKPMKGTRARGANAAQDAALRQELAQSEKDRAENLMILDLMRNDLARIAQPGSVQVEAPFAVETYPNVHQMVSSVQARLQAGKGAADVLRAIFPSGSITGAPKIRAMEMIQQVERDARGPYCGAIGRISANGDTAFNVAIRSLRLSPIENAHGRAVLGVGSAIVADSTPMQEWRESILKGAFVRSSCASAWIGETESNTGSNTGSDLGSDLRGVTGSDTGSDVGDETGSQSRLPLASPASFALIETMRFDPEQGIALIELHLERMKASAAQLGFSFDRHEARNQIHALCFDLEAPAKLRLLCARGGAIALETQNLDAPAGGFLCPTADDFDAQLAKSLAMQLALGLAEPVEGQTPSAPPASPTDSPPDSNANNANIWNTANTANNANALRCIALPLPVDPGDWRLRHKTNDRQFLDAGRDAAREYGADEALMLREDGLVTEASYANIFVPRGGKLLTPPTRLGLLPGVLRRALIEAGKAEEAELGLEDLARGFFLGNALRGLMAARLHHPPLGQ